MHAKIDKKCETKTNTILSTQQPCMFLWQVSDAM